MDKKFAELTKLYYSIGEVAQMFDVSNSLIRYWESEFSILKPQKNNKGDRRFTKQNIQQLELIYHLVKEKGYTLEGAKKEIRNRKSIRMKRKRLIEKLTMIRKGLEDLKNKV